MKTSLATLLLAGCSTIAVAQSQSKPMDLSVGWNYGYVDQGTGFSNLNGWYGVLSWEVTKRAAVSFEHESLWGGFQGAGANQHVWLGGATVKLRGGEPKVSPFVQPMGGVTRSSASGSVQDQPTFQLAVGADITLKGKLSLEIEPAEYSLTHGNGKALNSYEAGAGLQYVFGKKS